MNKNWEILFKKIDADFSGHATCTDDGARIHDIKVDEYTAY